MREDKGTPRRKSGGPSPVRTTAAAASLLAMFAGVAEAARALSSSTASELIAGGLGALGLVVLASPIEWAVHRYYYHRPWPGALGRVYRIHQHGHHHGLFPTWRYVTHGPVRRHVFRARSPVELHHSFWSNLGVKASHFAFYMTFGVLVVWPLGWLLSRSLPFMIGLVGASVVVSDLFVRVHDAIHYPEVNRWMQRPRWFRFLEQHHFIHHVDVNANVNFLLPLTDLLAGTRRRTLTDREASRHGTLEEAKARPIGRSEPAAEVAQPRSKSTPPPTGALSTNGARIA